MRVVYGTDGFSCRRFVTKCVSEWKSKGFEVHKVSGTPESIEEFISPMLSLFGNATPPAFVVDGGLDLDLDYLKKIDHPILFVVEGSLPRSKKHPIHSMPKNSYFKFNAPSVFQAEEAAINFSIEEAKGYGLVLSKQLATNLVKLVGTDFGVISNEILKMSMLADDSATVTPNHFRAIAQVSEVSAQDIITAVGACRVKSLLKALSSVSKTHQNDPTLLVCGWLGSEARKWLLCSSLKKQSRSLDQKTTGIHPYVLKKNILPSIKKWDEKSSLKLIHLLSDLERYVKTGGKQSWSKLESELVMLIQAVS